jgi:toxin ParE1/3/4
MSRRFRFTPEARSDLRKILLDIAADNPDSAERLRMEFHDMLHRLAKTPGMGHHREELLDRRDRFWAFYSYVICYAWQKRPIQIVAVVHGARDLAAFFDARAAAD